ncbi:iron transporter [Alphaproteobacteria bacterium]|nr:iron transporter [Alphaproteobacteria bacterium]
MLIETEATPNPNTLKFLPGRVVMAAGTASYASADAAERSPLARRIFAVDGVSSAFFGSDFVTVSKRENADWAALKPRLLTTIDEYYANGSQPEISIGPAGGGADEGPVVEKIRDLLDTRIRPMVANDGGDIVFCGFENGIVYLHMQGACSGCPNSAATLKHGVENMLKYYVPEVLAVEEVN